MAGLEVNAQAFVADLERAIERMVNKTRASFDKLADEIETREKGAAPKPRDGSRAATIHQRRVTGATKTVILIGPTVEAFSLVFDEFGAVHTPAHPWARPSIAAAWSVWEPLKG